MDGRGRDFLGFLFFFQVKDLPNILTINTGLDNERDLEYLRQITGSSTMADINDRGISENASPTSLRTTLNGHVKQCRYGVKCSRPDCHFAHPDR